MVDWLKAKEGIVERVLQDSETFLNGTVTIAASADQRAAVIAGTFATAAAAIVAGVIGFSAAAGADNVYALPIYVGGLSAALLFVIGAVFCISAAMLVEFHLPGTRPSGWEDDVAKGKNLSECQCDLIAIRENAITQNLKVLSANARNYKIGAACGIAAPVVGAVIWGAALFMRHCH
jgi:hypothetical protein